MVVAVDVDDVNADEYCGANPNFTSDFLWERYIVTKMSNKKTYTYRSLSKHPWKCC